MLLKVRGMSKPQPRINTHIVVAAAVAVIALAFIAVVVTAVAVKTRINVYAYLFNVMLASIAVNIGLSIYGLFARPSLVKKIIALSILGDSANVFAIAIGYRFAKPNPLPPIQVLPARTPETMNEYLYRFTDPLPPALVLTAVVIGLAVTLFLAFLTIQVYRLYGTTDVRKIARLRG